MKQLTTHRTPEVPLDPNNGLFIVATQKTQGGAFSEYEITAEGLPGLKIEFQTIKKTGVTNEALLAIVHERLTALQAGPFPCEENDVALRYVTAALEQLKIRTRRRHAAGLDGKMAEEQVRVKFVGEQLNIVGATSTFCLHLTDLSQWKTWNQVESKLRPLLPLGVTEWAAVEAAATAAGGGAKNGLAELKSALGQVVHTPPK